ncbi:TonB-dependent receptor plug domain-containing protein [Acetobacter sp.]|jgi:iron complex outermembrane receptor protein|uniref:TonB-dependent receptor plug domain-containing protein n=1 Tax=Acetobacter sp. TaxID=440 RepID=UPI0025C47C00|nr:hypothetical protein [Acetobacter sp.]MCH4089903.1 Plug domain-containing protein [Acetobacter sp.]MCI1298599.1 Plug domain-containing protein [Acetobacter sp.]MCI1315164.1 Plug domain-containing protein [Acetobacter sp.]
MTAFSQKLRRITLNTSVTSLGCALAMNAVAAAPHTSGAKKAKPVALQASKTEEVTVSVRRRSEPLQKVPVATSVYTAKQATKDNVHDLQGIFQFIPSANFRANASSKDRAIFVRGIGTVSTSPGV